jgi:hypothetical protein
MKKAIISIVVALVLIAAAMPLAIASADAEPPLDHVALSPTSVTLPINGAQQFTAVGQDSANAPVTGVTYTWGVIAGSGTITVRDCSPLAVLPAPAPSKLPQLRVASPRLPSPR